MPADASRGACPLFSPARAAWKPSNCKRSIPQSTSCSATSNGTAGLPLQSEFEQSLAVHAGTHTVLSRGTAVEVQSPLVHNIGFSHCREVESMA